MEIASALTPRSATGCLQCEMACSVERTGAINPSKSRIKVFSFETEGRKVPYTCTRCTGKPGVSMPVRSMRSVSMRPPAPSRSSTTCASVAGCAPSSLRQHQ